MHIQRHQQLFRHDPENGVYGDCFRTVIACFLGLTPADVPHVCNGPDDGKANDRMRDFLRSHGAYMVSVPVGGECSFAQVLTLGELWSGGLPYLLTGESRNGINHVVICLGDQIFHDTSLDGSGLVGPTVEGFWWLEWIVRPVSLPEVCP